MLSNQWVLLKAPREDFHCMEVYAENGATGYVIDYRESFDVARARNDVVSVEYDRQNNRWIETGRVPR